MPNTRWLICQRKLLQITAEEIACISMRAASDRSSIPRFYWLRSTQYIVHCVGDVIMPTRYELLCYFRHDLSAVYPGVKSVV
jgi:hypothetical protein